MTKKGDTLEKELYPPLQNFLEGEGYSVERELSVYSRLSGKTRKLDLVGFKWNADGQVDAWAIEAKRGSNPSDLLTGLAQGVEYQLYSPRVSLAAEADRKRLGFAEDPLRRLGLGYISVRGKTATEIIQPAYSPHLYCDEFNTIIRHAGCLKLLGETIGKHLNETLRSHSDAKKDPRGRLQSNYGIHTNQYKVQIMLNVRRRESANLVTARVWVESKNTLRRIVKKIGEHPNGLIDLMVKHNLKGLWEDYERSSWGNLLDVEKRNTVEPTRKSMTKAARWADRVLRKKQHVPCMSWKCALWRLSDSPSRQEAEASLAKALKKLLPIRDCLLSLSGEKT